MKRIFITLITAVCLAAPSFAQENSWFVSAGGGANISFEGYRNDNGATGTAPALSVGVGKWFNENIGAKLGYDGLKLKNKTFFSDGFNYSALTASFLWNASNTISGEDDCRVFFIVPYAFAGAAFGENASFTAGAGLSFPINVSKSISIVPDLKLAYLQDRIFTDLYNGMNLVFEPTIGLSYSF